MLDLLLQMHRWQTADTAFAFATVVRTWNSAPRETGATMAVSEHGEAVGSVSGGCVESAVYAVAEEVIETGHPQLVQYGVDDGDAFAQGLTCGGTIEILVQPGGPAHFPELELVRAAIEADEPVAVVTVVNAGDAGVPLGARILLYENDVHATFDLGLLDTRLVESARHMLSHATTGHLEIGCDGPSVLIQSFAPKPRMLVFGAIDFAAAVTRMGKFLGYHVTVCDARPVFATAARFPEADEVVVSWPHRYLAGTVTDSRTVMCVLTHDEKFDVPLLERALRSPAAYIGAMGSRRTHERRSAALLSNGLTPDELSRLHSPIGLDLHAASPEETAVSIAAEIIAATHGASARPLRDTTGAIHPTAALVS